MSKKLALVLLSFITLLPACANFPGSPTRTDLVDRDPSRAKARGYFVLGSEKGERGANPGGYVPRTPGNLVEQPSKITQTTPAPAPRNPGEPVVLKKLTVSGAVLFPVGKSTLSETGKKELQAWITELKDNKTAKLAIYGFTDSAGNPAANQKLSARRAASVRLFMIEKGDIKAERLTAKGMGASKPIASNDTPDGRAANRRVEAEVLE